MIYIVHLIKIAAYFLICRVLYVQSKRSFKKNKQRMTWMGLFLGAFLLGIYSIYITNPNLNLSHDRLNYYERYSEFYDISLDSLGLNWLFEQLRPISLSASFLWFSTAFLFVFITFVAFKYFKQASPYSLLFILCSIYFFFGFAGMKQSFANAFGCLSFMLYFNMPYMEERREKWLSVFFIILSIIAAILFHEVAILLIVIYIAFLGWNIKLFRNLGWMFMVIAIVAFPYISNILFADLAALSESLEEQTAGYANQENGSVGNYMTVFKGMPYYIITYVGFMKRKQLLSTIVNYDRYLLLAATVSLTTLASYFNYWYFRFGMLMYLPVFVYSSTLYEIIPYRDPLQKWIKAAFIITVLLSVKELAQYYFLYGGI